MSSIMRDGDTFHGVRVVGRGVFTNHKFGDTYAGQCRGGYACGLGVVTSPNGDKAYAEHGRDGKLDGRQLVRWDGGDTDYFLYERGEEKEDSADVFADGTCKYNGEFCAPDDPRLLALIAQVAPVEVRRSPSHPTAIAAHSPPSDLGRLVSPPQALAAAVATEVQPPTPARVVARHSPTAAALQSTSTQ